MGTEVKFSQKKTIPSDDSKKKPVKGPIIKNQLTTQSKSVIEVFISLAKRNIPKDHIMIPGFSKAISPV